MVKILFVCLGNICRSPSAEGIMKELVKKEGLENKIELDSAGVGAWHVGEQPDIRMRKSASKRGITLNHKARQIKPDDLSKFDYVVAMDRNNLSDIKDMAKVFKIRPDAEIILITDYLDDKKYKDGVPDPYELGASFFDLVLDIEEKACKNLLRKIVEENKLK